MKISQNPTLLDMPSIGLGTYMLRGKTCVETVRTALELGYRHIDTAEMYGNEVEIGEALDLSTVPRHDIFITTKVWPNNFAAAAFTRTVEQSLRHLKTDYLDLVLLHWPRGEVPIAETIGALTRLVEAGKVRRGGVSNFSVSQMKEALHAGPNTVTCNQVKCHFGDVPEDVIRYARQQGIAITAYSPLGQGSVQRDVLLREIATKYDATPSQIALRWLTQQGIVVIPKTSNAARLKENLDADKLTLGDNVISRLGIL